MKREIKGMRLAEGWLIVAVLALAALSFLLVEMNRRPPTIEVEPVHSLSAEALRTPAPAPLDLNAAGVQELAALPGIGEALAERIVAYREEKGAFASPEELDEVPGIGEGKIAAIQGLVFCG